MVEGFSEKYVHLQICTFQAVYGNHFLPQDPPNNPLQKEDSDKI